MNIITWLLIIIAAIVFEAVTVELVTVWFIPAAIISGILCAFGCNTTIQIVVFLVISFANLLLFRKKALDKLKIERNKKYLPENVGETGIVIEPIDRYKGRIFVSGLDWAAKTKSENTIEKGKEVIIEAVEGVTLIVSEKKN